ncbi:hypothetical protein L6164_019662 [Bauhinia variegata]|uniref:Uncharacterized protein n=1 Tax=Bauhinia variegata TaxID=167791 RepID=A0ACB9MXA4_BAUVA|nr:hypothetical protein L6164_019662 [Bauhinia variegata]
MKRRQFYFFEPEKDAEDPSDDACLVCADGGKLTCCGKCPNTVHSFCMEMEMDTVGDWLCPYCVCKYCGLRGDDIQSEHLINCPQCDKKFHRACLIEEKEKEGVNLNCWKSYCEQSCRKIHEKLESLVGVRNKLDDRYCWQIIRTTNDNNNDKLHHKMECNAKVALAWNLIDESFESITDRLTGIDVIQRVMYSCGSNLTRTNFRRFYTFIIEKEKEDEIICAACIRVHGRRIAEMPFITTAENYRRQGICGMLLAVIESILCSLKVEKLILPAVMEVQAMWKKYGFTELESELTREITCYNILTFPGLVRLHKDLRQHITGARDYGNNHNDGPQRPFLDLNVEPPPEDDI